jgi:hypothetical protein
MAEESSRFLDAISRVDAANAEHATTLDYSRRMTRWLEQLVPNAGEELRLAVRAQHIRRWMFPRNQFPMTRAGYHQWRSAAGRFHADEVGKILRDVGYGDAIITRVQSLVRKEGLKSDPETQALEDATCLAFLEDGFAEFAQRHDDAKIIGIVRRTWKKMSPAGQQAALGLPFSGNARLLIEKALSADAGETEGP